MNYDYAFCWVFLLQVKGEVSRLQQLKSSKMKEIVLRKRLELEEVCRKMHMVTEEFQEYPPEVLESGKSCRKMQI